MLLLKHQGEQQRRKSGKKKTKAQKGAKTRKIFTRILMKASSSLHLAPTVGRECRTPLSDLHVTLSPSIVVLYPLCQESPIVFPYLCMIPNMYLISHADPTIDSMRPARDSIFTFDLLLSSLAGKSCTLYLVIISFVEFSRSA